MLYSLIVLASATLSAAWPAIFYSDVNCTAIVATYEKYPENKCIDTSGVQSYRGSLDSDKQELLIYKEPRGCEHDPNPAAVIDGSPQKCVFIYKSVGPFPSAKIAPVEKPAPLRLSQQD